MRKVIITGANGFIGSALVRYLLKKDIMVYAVSRSHNNLMSLEKNSNLKIVKADFEEYLYLDKVIKDDNFDCFFHFAWEGYGANTNNYQIQYKNIKAAGDAVTLAIKLKSKKFFFAESSHEYLKDANDNFCSIYGIAKTAAKNISKDLCIKNNIYYVGGIFANVFGIGDFSNRSSNMILKKLLLNQDVDLIEGNNYQEWTYIDDAINGILSVVKEGRKNQSYFISRGNMYTFKEIIILAKDALESKSNLNFGRYKENSKIDYSLIDINKIFRDTTFVIKEDLSNQIKISSKWIKEHLLGV